MTRVCAVAIGATTERCAVFDINPMRYCYRKVHTCGKKKLNKDLTLAPAAILAMRIRAPRGESWD